MSGWGDREFQKARKENSLVIHTKQVQFDKERTPLPVYQYYSTKTKAVQCCIVPNQVVSLHTAPSMQVETNLDECILVWQNQHADVYDQKKMEFKKKLGNILFDPRVWKAFWLYDGPTDVMTVDDIDDDLHRLKELADDESQPVHEPSPEYQP